MNTEDGPRPAKFQHRRTLRLTDYEDSYLVKQAELSGLSVSEIIRRRIFGGRPIVAHVDVMTVNELRRIGGLLKNNFETMRQAKANPDLFKKQESALHLLRTAIEKISTAYRHDREES